MTFARSMVTTSGACPYKPNSEIEPARNRCALPHQPTARISKFCTHMKSMSSPSIDSTEIDTENKALTSSDMDTHPSTCGNAEFPAQAERLTPSVQTMSEGDLDTTECSAGRVDHP